MFDDLVLVGAASARRRRSCKLRLALRTVERKGGAGGHIVLL